MANHSPDSKRLFMQRAVLQPFPSIDKGPSLRLSEVERLDTIIQNVETHHRQVKDAILAASLSSLPFYSTAKDPNASNLADPQLTPRDAPSNKSHGQEALLASLRVPHGHKRKKRISGADRPPAPDAGAGDDPVLSRVKEALSRLEEYERVSTATIATLNAEKVQKAKEDEGLGSTMASGTAAKTTAYDSSRDPRLGTRGTDDSGAKAVAYDQSRDPRLKR